MKPKRNYKPGPMDDCQTPEYGIEPLLIGLMDKGIVLSKQHIWEPASGEGFLARRMRSYGLDVSETDITLGVDFLDYPYVPDCDAIITNPPWKLKKFFTRKCLELGVPFALIYQTESISQKWFIDLVSEYGEPGIIHFSPRINFKMPVKGWDGTGAQMETSWFTWGWFKGNVFLRMDYWTKEYRRRFET